MKLSCKKTILLTLLCCQAAMIARAEHATNFLDALHREVTNRFAHLPTNSTPAQRRALMTTSKTLSRNTTTFATDLGLLASAVTALRASFANDQTFIILESQALERYSAEANARLNWLVTHIGTNAIARGTSNQLAQGRSALNRSSNVSNSVPVRARTLATAFTKFGLADAQIRRTIQAPASLADKGVRLSEDAIVNDQTNFYLDHAGGTGIYNVDRPEELGLWSYQRVSPRVGVVMLMPNFPPEATTTRALTLVFTNLTGGTFTGQNIAGENLRGKFLVSE